MNTSQRHCDTETSHSLELRSTTTQTSGVPRRLNNARARSKRRCTHHGSDARGVRLAHARWRLSRGVASVPSLKCEHKSAPLRHKEPATHSNYAAQRPKPRESHRESTTHGRKARPVHAPRNRSQRHSQRTTTPQQTPLAVERTSKTTRPLPSTTHHNYARRPGVERRPKRRTQSSTQHRLPRCTVQDDWPGRLPGAGAFDAQAGQKTTPCDESHAHQASRQPNGSCTPQRTRLVTRQTPAHTRTHYAKLTAAQTRQKQPQDGTRTDEG